MAQNPELKPGDTLSADWWPESVEAESGTDNNNVTSTSFIAGSPEVGVQFVAARSGRAAVCVSGAMVEQSAGDRLFLSFQVYRGTSASGTLVYDARTVTGICTHGDTTAAGGQEESKGNMTMVDGLTPGSTHYARIVHSTEAGTTNDVTHRRITVIPLP
jgi:hypothetical protein